MVIITSRAGQKQNKKVSTYHDMLFSATNCETTHHCSLTVEFLHINYST